MTTLSDKMCCTFLNGKDGILFRKDVKEFIKQDTEFLDINKNILGHQFPEVVVTAINLMFHQRTKKLAGDKLL